MCASSPVSAARSELPLSPQEALDPMGVNRYLIVCLAVASVRVLERRHRGCGAARGRNACRDRPRHRLWIACAARVVQCGVTTGVAGFSTPDAQGEWHGLDVDVCRAIAAAVLGDAKKVRFTPLTAAQRFTALQTGEVDVLSRITTITFQRDVQLGIEFPAVNWCDGTTFIVRKSSHVQSVKDLNGATICVQPGTTNEVDVADYFRKYKLTFTPVVIERLVSHQRVLCGTMRCVQPGSGNARRTARACTESVGSRGALRADPPGGPDGPGCAERSTVAEIVRWSVYAMVNAEELGLDVDDDRSDARQRRPGRAPVCQGEWFGQMLGLDAAWAYRIVKQVGNYAESVERNIAPLGVERGVNRLWKDGGVVYVPPLR